MEHYDYQFSQVKFNKLQYFEGENMRAKTVNNIIKTTKNLKFFFLT